MDIIQFQSGPESLSQVMAPVGLESSHGIGQAFHPESPAVPKPLGL